MVEPLIGNCFCALSVLSAARVSNYTPEKLAALREAFIASRDPSRNQGNLL